MKIDKKLQIQTQLDLATSKQPVSGKQVIKAGSYLAFGDYRNEKEFQRCFRILVWWRSEHAVPLESAFKLLETIVVPIEKNALFAKRLKRYDSIVRKLQRFDKMTLKKMQDIGGCRAIVASEKKIQKIVRQLKKKSVFKFDKQFRIKNYIENPKQDGYRSYHIIGAFLSNEGLSKTIELQIRTYLQHYWATALEIIDLFTNQSLKTNQGRQEWEVFFQIVGGLFADLDKISNYHNLEFREKVTGYLSQIKQESGDSKKQIVELTKISYELDVFKLFSSFANSLKIVGEQLSEHEEAGYILIGIDLDKGQLEYTIFNREQSLDAQKLYASKEEKAALPDNNLVVALVYTNSLEDVVAAYPNFFADSTKFLEHLNVLIEAGRGIRESSIKKSLSRWFRT